MGRLWLFAPALLAGGCGVADTGTVTATAAAPAAQQAAQAPQAEERVRQQLGSAERQAAEQRRAAETDGQ
jgi:hypothetical protein